MIERLNHLYAQQAGAINYGAPEVHGRPHIRSEDDLALVNRFLVELGRDVSAADMGHGRVSPSMMQYSAGDDYNFFEPNGLEHLGLAGMPGIYHRPKKSLPRSQHNPALYPTLAESRYSTEVHGHVRHASMPNPPPTYVRPQPGRYPQHLPSPPIHEFAQQSLVERSPQSVSSTPSNPTPPPTMTLPMQMPGYTHVNPGLRDYPPMYNSHDFAPGVGAVAGNTKYQPDFGYNYIPPPAPAPDAPALGMIHYANVDRKHIIDLQTDPSAIKKEDLDQEREASALHGYSKDEDTKQESMVIDEDGEPDPFTRLSVIRKPGDSEDKLPPLQSASSTPSTSSSRSVTASPRGGSGSASPSSHYATTLPGIRSVRQACELDDLGERIGGIELESQQKQQRSRSTTPTSMVSAKDLRKQHLRLIADLLVSINKDYRERFGTPPPTRRSVTPPSPSSPSAASPSGTPRYAQLIMDAEMIAA
jgi:hypothetical protein